MDGTAFLIQETYRPDKIGRHISDEEKKRYWYQRDHLHAQNISRQGRMV